jgi:hypothetical protein
MLSFVRSLKLAIGFAAAFLVAGLAFHSSAQAATGTVHMRLVNGGVVIGGTGGEGTLTLYGRTYRFKVSGGGIGTIGIAETHLSGTAAHLRSPRDFFGDYTTSGAGLAVGGGGNVLTLQNQRGVVLQLEGPQVGFQASLGVGGVTISAH